MREAGIAMPSAQMRAKAVPESEWPRKWLRRIDSKAFSGPRRLPYLGINRVSAGRPCACGKAQHARWNQRCAAFQFSS